MSRNLQGNDDIDVGASPEAKVVESYRDHVLTFTHPDPGWVVSVEGSNDGTTWALIGTSAASGSMAGDTHSAIDRPWRYLRARVSVTAGGQPPTATYYGRRM